MTGKDVVLGFLERVKAKDGWEDLLADDLEFSNLAHPARTVTGKQASLEGVRRFYGMVRAMEVRRIIAEGEHVCALVRYELQPPAGPSFESFVAELYEVRDGAIRSFAICFDSTPYPKPASPPK